MTALSNPLEGLATAELTDRPSRQQRVLRRDRECLGQVNRSKHPTELCTALPLALSRRLEIIRPIMRTVENPSWLEGGVYLLRSANGAKTLSLTFALR